MNSTKKNIQKTSGIHRLGKFYKPGQLITIDRHVYRITKTNELMKNLISVWNYQQVYL